MSNNIIEEARSFIEEEIPFDVNFDTVFKSKLGTSYWVESFKSDDHFDTLIVSVTTDTPDHKSYKFNIKIDKEDEDGPINPSLDLGSPKVTSKYNVFSGIPETDVKEWLMDIIDDIFDEEITLRKEND